MGREFLVESLRIMGPAFLVSVAYLDPGNWATAIEAGSRFGYELVWVVVLSSLSAILLQTLAARLGLVTGKHLAQVCREAYPPMLCYLLWVLCEISIVALDLTMVLGTAIGLNLLFGMPQLPAILLTGLDAVLLLLLVPRGLMRQSELLTVALLGIVVLCFIVELLVIQPPLANVVAGLVPRLRPEQTLTAVSLLGANVMPHNFFLHSALVIGQTGSRAGQPLGRLCFFNFIDISCALGVALVVNVAVLLVAAATFHSAGVVVETLQDAHDLMEQILSSSIAPAAFGTALLCAGQLSTFTGTISGQVVLKGFLNISISTWLRRLLTRSAAIIPAAILQHVYGDRGTFRLLMIAQVVLALQLPCTLVPLIKATSHPGLMGRYHNSWWLSLASWGSLGIIFSANAAMLVTELVPRAMQPTADVQVDLDAAGPAHNSVEQWLDSMAAMAWQHPLQFGAVILAMVTASCLMALQLWMIVTPMRYSEAGTQPHNTQLNHKDSSELGIVAYDEQPHRGSPSDLEHGPLAPLLPLKGSQDAVVEEAHHPPSKRHARQLRLQQLDQAAGSQLGPILLPYPIEPIPARWKAPINPPSTTPMIEAAPAQPLKEEVVDSWEDLEDAPGALAGALPQPAVQQQAPPQRLRQVPSGDWSGLSDMDAVSDAGMPPASARRAATVTSDSEAAQQRGMGRGGRRQLASVLDGFWASLFDAHGNLLPSVGRAQPAPHMNSWLPPQPVAESWLRCAHSSPMCPACGSGMLSRMCVCIQEVLAIPAAPASLWGCPEVCLCASGECMLPAGAWRSRWRGPLQVHEQLVACLASRDCWLLGECLAQLGLHRSASLQPSYPAAHYYPPPFPWQHAGSHSYGSQGWSPQGPTPPATPPGSSFQGGWRSPRPSYPGEGLHPARSRSEEQLWPHPGGTTITAEPLSPASSSGSQGVSGYLSPSGLWFPHDPAVPSSMQAAQGPHPSRPFVAGEGPPGPAGWGRPPAVASSDAAGRAAWWQPLLADWALLPQQALLSFAVWSAATMLEACISESRPELWGKYAFVLNKLQGMLEELADNAPATRTMLAPGVSLRGHFEGLRAQLLAMLDTLERSLSDRRGPAGTAAGDVAFPKGKEIMMSVVKRYRRKLAVGLGQPPAGAGYIMTLLAPLMMSMLLMGLAILSLTPADPVWQLEKAM